MRPRARCARQAAADSVSLTLRLGKLRARVVALANANNLAAPRGPRELVRRVPVAQELVSRSDAASSVYVCMNRSHGGSVYCACGALRLAPQSVHTPDRLK